MKQQTTFTCTEAACLLGIHPLTLLRWQKEGRIAAFKVGREWRFPRGAVYAFERGEQEPDAQDAGEQILSV
jgi:excisionase family DNA binding protein